jgi:uncharacterized protein YPO0396
MKEKRMENQLFRDVKFTRSYDEQFRLTRLQIHNWGTFQNYHDIFIPREGFLFVGASGSGKTTLLDAMSTVLNPHASTEYNTAARDAKKSDRTLISYVRGAWAAKTSEESGEIVTDFLRNGATLSAIAMTYKTGPDGDESFWGKKIVTLLQLFWTTENTNSGLKRHYIIAERNLDLDSLRFDGKVSKSILKKELPNDFHFDEFAPYSERMRRLLGIKSEKTLKLLQKTQSMKNIENLETFLKDYMLDKPQTYGKVEEMLNEFESLNRSHEIVVIANRQIKLLDQARKEYFEYLDAEKNFDSANKLKIHLRDYFGLKLIDLYRAALTRKEAEKIALEEAVKTCKEKYEKALKDYEDLIQTRFEQGGGKIAKLANDIETLKKQFVERGRARDAAIDLCQKLGYVFPDTEEDFALLMARVATERDEIQKKNVVALDEYENLIRLKIEADTKYKKDLGELSIIEKQNSNIPGVYLERRKNALEALNMENDDLPFVGELLDVKAQERHWQGAIERAYKDLAVSVLVEDDKGAALSNYVNDNNLKGSFSFIRKVNNNHDALPTISPDLLSQKMEVKNGDHKVWLEREIRRAYDYHCADSMDEFRRHEYSVTINGHVRRGRTFYEKDDSYDLADIKKWVIGFDNQKKLELFRTLVAEDKIELDSVIRQVDQNIKERDLRSIRLRDSERLSEISFENTNVLYIRQSLDAAVKRKEDLEKDPELKNLEKLIEKQKNETDVFFNKHTDVSSNLRTVQNEVKNFKVKFDDAVTDYANGKVPHDISAQLDKMVANKFSRDIDLNNIFKFREDLRESLNKDLGAFKNLMDRTAETVKNLFAEFKRQWPDKSSDQDATLEYANDFMAKLERLEKEDLPIYEKDFFYQLNIRSGRYTAKISHLLTSEVRHILERLEEVNKCLSDVPFSLSDRKPTFLKVKTSPKHIQDVDDFKKRLQEVSSYSLTEDRSSAEYRFHIQKGIVEDLTSLEKDKILWRDLVLDVRNHLEFIGVELDEENNEVESYRSGSGKSGGQRQKLAATCLAAALRYQLGGRDLGYPAYGTVVFDEAFAKTDNEHTKLAMDIFTKLGFQLIMATPNKGVIVAEPYIGGAAYICIKNRDSSYASRIRYDTIKRKLIWPASDEPGETQNIPSESLSNEVDLSDGSNPAENPESQDL